MQAGGPACMPSLSPHDARSTGPHAPGSDWRHPHGRASLSRKRVLGTGLPPQPQTGVGHWLAYHAGEHGGHPPRARKWVVGTACLRWWC
jgi:hypothetical protein